MVTVEQAVLIALDHHQSGRWAEAEELYRRILQADPLCADALLLLGVLLSQTGRAAQGAGALRHAVCLRPDGAGVLSNLAGALQTTGDAAAAERAYRRALYCDPLLADAHASRAAALRALGRSAEAAGSATLALALAPAHADALVNRADALLAALDGAGAERLARRALVAGGDRPMVRLTLGAALARQQRWAEAEAELRAALVRQPRLGEAWESLGSVLAKQGRAAESLAAFTEAEALRPGPDLWAARGTALISLARPAEALADFDRALAVRPQDAGLHWNRGFARLLAGDYAGGWPEFDWRRCDDRAEPPWRSFPQPIWRGEDIAGRTILLHAEQGLGDTLQFLRYVPLVAARGARVVLEVQPPLLPLLAGMEGAAKVIARGDPLPPFDLECPLMSLPLAFGTTLDSVPAEVPYLRPDPRRVARWQARLGEGKPKVGLVWAGNPRFPGDRLRSPRLEGLRPLLGVPGVGFFGLQMGAGREDLAGAELPAGFTDLGPEIADWADTAAIMAGLDLVISSCTGPAHLAGALGVPLWVALPFSPDWRWLLDREDSPWYPTARLFRQPAVGDWASVARRMAGALAALA